MVLVITVVSTTCRNVIVNFFCIIVYTPNTVRYIHMTFCGFKTESITSYVRRNLLYIYIYDNGEVENNSFVSLVKMF